MAHIQDLLRDDRRRVGARWQARYLDPTGRERSKTFHRKADAEHFLTSTLADLQRGSWVNPSLAKTTVGEWARRWIEALAIKPKTRAGYDSLLKTLVLPRWDDVPLGGVDNLAVAEWVTGMVARGLSASRTRQAYNLLTAMLDAAVRAGYLPANRARGVPLPRLVQREPVFLSHQQVHELAAAAGTHGPLILLLGYTGVRWGEAAALRVRRVDMLRCRLEIAESLAEVNGRLIFGPTKTHQRRTVAMPRLVRDAVAPLLTGKKPDDLVFTSPTGKPLRLANWRRRAFDPAVRAVGLHGLTPHGLRHTCASLLIAEGAHPKAVQQQLGHSSVAVTIDRYGHLFGDELDKLAEGLQRAAQAAKIVSLTELRRKKDGAAYRISGKASR